MSDRPVVVVTRRLPEACERAAAERFDARLNASDAPLGADGLREALRTAYALLTTVTDQVTAQVLAVEPLRARLIANFGVGYNTSTSRPRPGRHRGHQHARRIDRRHRRHSR